MNFKSTHHIYKCAPPVLGNDKSENPVVVGLRGVSMADRDKAKLEEMQFFKTHTAEKAQELLTEHTYNLVKSHVQSIEGLELDGKECTDFDTLYNEGPPELVNWVFLAIFSTELLTGAEVKN